MFNHLYNFKAGKVQKTDTSINMNLDKNKENTIAFYRTAYLGQPKLAVEKYVGKEYIQHNPAVANGTQGFIDYFEQMQLEYPDKTIEFLRCIGEGNLVALHTHQTWPGNDKYITMDFFRFDTDGKICEHWDSIQQIPEKSENPNTMY
jgi:predicted SnoaL-like aldol condensation-catalyzing enzyme